MEEVYCFAEGFLQRFHCDNQHTIIAESAAAASSWSATVCHDVWHHLSPDFIGWLNHARPKLPVFINHVTSVLLSQNIIHVSK